MQYQHFGMLTSYCWSSCTLTSTPHHQPNTVPGISHDYKPTELAWMYTTARPSAFQQSGEHWWFMPDR